MPPDLFAPGMAQTDWLTEPATATAPAAGGLAIPPAGQPEPTPGLLAELDRWADQGWLRRLDSAMARFVVDLSVPAGPRAPVGNALAMATALLMHLEGRGHTCLPLAAVAALGGAPSLPQAQPQPSGDWLAWPAAALAALQAQWAAMPRDVAGWVLALRASPVVRDALSDPADPMAPDAGQPLVLAGTLSAPLLYLRRHWVAEGQVVQAVARANAEPLAVDEPAARAWLDTLLGPANPVATTDTGTRTGTAGLSCPAAVAVAAPSTASAALDWQRVACALALRGRFTVITGGPGTGKTYTAARLLALLLALHPGPGPLRVALAAPTGKAAARLRQAIDQALQGLQARIGPALDLAGLVARMGPASTVHALLGARPGTRLFQRHAAHPLDLDVLIVDETSMVNLELMAALLQALPPQARLVVLGDKDQLASVEAGAVLGDLCAHAEHTRYHPDTVAYVQATCAQALPASAGPWPLLAQHTVMLRESRRFGTTIGQLATAVNAGDGPGALAVLARDRSGAVWVAPATAQAPTRPEVVLGLALAGRDQAPGCFVDYLRLVRLGASSGPSLAHTDWVRAVLKAWEGFRILCAVHDGPWGDRALNQGVQRALAQAGWLQPEGEWYVGRPVMVTRNDAGLGVFNGDVGVVLPSAHGPALRACFLDGEQVRSVPVSRLAHVETAFAMTVHKSQGSEFAHTVLVLPPGAGAGLSRELVYTGITRARTHLSLVEGAPGLLATAIGQRVVRASGLHARLA